MSYRTNRRTRGIFRVGRETAVHRTVAKHTLPSETQAYKDAAESYGLKARVEQKRISSLKWRGFPMGEELVGNDRIEYIKSHINSIPLIVINGKTGDIIDGNHRYRVYKQLGFKMVPVLAVSGSEEGLDALEQFAQNWNNNAEWENLPDKPYEKTLVSEMSEGVRCEYCGNLRDRCSCIVGGLR